MNVQIKLDAGGWNQIEENGLNDLLIEFSNGNIELGHHAEWAVLDDNDTIQQKWWGSPFFVKSDKKPIPPTHYRIWTETPVKQKTSYNITSDKDISSGTMDISKVSGYELKPDPLFRTFESGATRDNDIGKLDYEGFFCPATLKRFAEYMNENRQMKDGSLRDSDNWQKGFPKDQLIKSATRHFMDWRLHHRGYSDKATETLEDSICGLIFNSLGFLKLLVDEKV